MWRTRALGQGKDSGAGQRHRDHHQRDGYHIVASQPIRLSAAANGRTRWHCNIISLVLIHCPARRVCSLHARSCAMATERSGASLFVLADWLMLSCIQCSR